MKRILSSLLVAALVVLMTAGSLGTASAEQPAAASIEASDIDLQLYNRLFTTSARPETIAVFVK